MGYSRAGFDVVGVDIEPQPHYPFEVSSGGCARVPSRYAVDHMETSRALRRHPCVATVSGIHATMSAKHRGKGGLADQRLDLLTPTLELLRPMDIPWVVENVQGSVPPLRPTLKLHGGMFDLGVHRPRLFESNVMLLAPRMPECREPVGVYGNAPDSRALWVRKNPRFRNNGNWRPAANPKKSVLRAPGQSRPRPGGDGHGLGRLARHEGSNSTRLHRIHRRPTHATPGRPANRNEPAVTPARPVEPPTPAPQGPTEWGTRRFAGAL